MADTTRLIAVTLAALALGIAIPVLVQLYTTLKDLQRAVNRLDQRIEPALRDLSQVLADMKEAPNPSTQTAASLVAALVPAAIAAVRAFRATASAPHAATANGSPPGTSSKSATQEGAS